MRTTPMMMMLGMALTATLTVFADNGGQASPAKRPVKGFYSIGNHYKMLRDEPAPKIALHPPVMASKGFFTMNPGTHRTKTMPVKVAAASVPLRFGKGYYSM